VGLFIHFMPDQQEKLIAQQAKVEKHKESSTKFMCR